MEFPPTRATLRAALGVVAAATFLFGAGVLVGGDVGLAAAAFAATVTTLASRSTLVG